jgi:hypothetical protein
MTKLCTTTPKFKRLQKELLLQTFSPEDFGRCKEGLRKTNTPFFTYNPKNERPIKYCVKFIPNDISTEEIEQDLLAQKIPFLAVNRIYNNKTLPKTPTQVILITINGTDAAAFQKLKHLCRLSVKTEIYNNNNLPQCHNCQRFGHSSYNCHLQPYCVKCGGKHASTTCKIKLNPENPAATEALIKCCNCNGNHPASYRGCPAYIKAKAQHAEKSKTKTAPPKPSPQAPEMSKKNFPVPAPLPKINAWTKKPIVQNAAPATVAATVAAPTPAPASTSTTDDTFDLKSVFSQIKDLIAEYIDIKKLWAAVLKIIFRLKTEAKSSDDVLSIIIEEASSSFLTIFK